MRKPNNLLERDVREQLEWDRMLDASRIVDKADDGKITLTGTVPTYFESMLAVEDAYRVSGVTGVDNQLLVGSAGEAIDDAVLAQDCAAAFDKDRLIPHGAVKATVADGRVTLRGEVRNHFQRREAAHAVHRVPGVLGVTNEISLTRDPIPSDVADRIHHAFQRNAVVDDSMIKVSNDDHTIFLDGTVESRRASLEAEFTAWDAPGVNQVVNRLMIIP